jgi:hypothetical protein
MAPTPRSWVQGAAKPGSHFSTLRASLSRSRCSWSGASSRIFHRAASAPPLRFRTPYEARFRHPATRQEPNSTRRIIPLSAPVRRKHPRAFSEPANQRSQAGIRAPSPLRQALRGGDSEGARLPGSKNELCLLMTGMGITPRVAFHCQICRLVEPKIRPLLPSPGRPRKPSLRTA